MDLLLLFYSNLQLTLQLASSHLHAVIIDLENIGKDNRQQLYDTQVSKHSISDLVELRAATTKRIICRVNGGEYLQESEINNAINEGADEILLPMVQHPSEVERTLKLINGQCPLGILVETNDAVQCIDELIQFPLSRIYFGLNDFAIDNQNSNIFTPLLGDIIYKIRQASANILFGFGGLTHPDEGIPIPSKLLLAEMARINCNFTFLRRSFYRDLANYSAEEIYKGIAKEWQHNLGRDNDEIMLDNQKLKSCILQPSHAN